MGVMSSVLKEMLHLVSVVFCLLKLVYCNLVIHVQVFSLLVDKGLKFYLLLKFSFLKNYDLIIQQTLYPIFPSVQLFYRGSENC